LLLEKVNENLRFCRLGSRALRWFGWSAGEGRQLENSRCVRSVIFHLSFEASLLFFHLRLRGFFPLNFHCLVKLVKHLWPSFCVRDRCLTRSRPKRPAVSDKPHLDGFQSCLGDVATAYSGLFQVIKLIAHVE
jgi:hypothetical protein